MAVDGAWSVWASWTSCSQTCGWGLRRRDRFCIPPQYMGRTCHGEASHTEDCKSKTCPGVFFRVVGWPMPCCIDCLICKLCSGWSVDGMGGLEPLCGHLQLEHQVSNTMQWYAMEAESLKLRNTRSRARSCAAPAFGGFPCPAGKNLQAEKCDLNCPSECFWNFLSCFGAWMK